MTDEEKPQATRHQNTRTRPPDITRTGRAYIGQSTLAKHLGVSRATISNWFKRHADFPQPDATVDGVPIWLETRLGEWEEWVADAGLGLTGDTVERLTQADIARLFGVRPLAVANWLKKYQDTIPKPDRGKRNVPYWKPSQLPEWKEWVRTHIGKTARSRAQRNTQAGD